MKYGKSRMNGSRMRLNSGVEVTRRPAGPRACVSTPEITPEFTTPCCGSWTPSLSLPRQTMAGDGREEMPWENLFADHMQDDFATVSGSGSSPEEEVFSNL
jgi:hypothetical protein